MVRFFLCLTPRFLHIAVLNNHRGSFGQPALPPWLSQMSCAIAAVLRLQTNQIADAHRNRSAV